MQELAQILDCDGSSLLSIVHEPDKPGGDIGVVIIVAGGPQYRVGAHRQFVLMARQLAKQGMTVIRFDHRGTGDSGGLYRGFMDMNSDIRCVVDHLSKRYPNLKSIALWGECESASAAAYYAHMDERVSGICLVNPWVRTDEGLAKTYLRHHYRARLFDPEFWKKVRSGQFSISESYTSLISLIKQVIGSSLSKLCATGSSKKLAMHELPLTERLEESLLRFSKEIMVLTSGRDHIAQEYKDFANSSKRLRKHLNSNRVQLHEVADSDHTFSRLPWRQELFQQSEDWLVKVGRQKSSQSERDSPPGIEE